MCPKRFLFLGRVQNKEGVFRPDEVETVGFLPPPFVGPSVCSLGDLNRLSRKASKIMHLRKKKKEFYQTLVISKCEFRFMTPFVL